MKETLRITPTESITVQACDEDHLLIEATYLPGRPPPKHFHPEQDEHFQILGGELHVNLDGVRRAYGRGDTFDIPRGTIHTLGCSGSEPARVLWQTTPAGRTLEWFRAINRLQVERRVGRNGMPSALAFGVLLTEYRDTFRLAGPDWMLRPALVMLAGLGRRRGYRP